MSSARPQAEVVLQQTWAYHLTIRAWSSLACGESTRRDVWRLTDATTRRPDLGGVRIILTGQGGAAVGACSGTVQALSALAAENAALAGPSASAGALVNIGWKDSETGEMALWRDTIHLNARTYLQACMWFAFLKERPLRLLLCRNRSAKGCGLPQEVVAKALAERDQNADFDSRAPTAEWRGAAFTPDGGCEGGLAHGAA